MVHSNTSLLPARELEMVALIASGKTTIEIAERLGMRPSVVNGCVANVCADTGARSAVQAARLYLERLTLAPTFG